MIDDLDELFLTPTDENIQKLVEGLIDKLHGQKDKYVIGILARTKRVSGIATLAAVPDEPDTYLLKIIGINKLDGNVISHKIKMVVELE